MKFLKWVLGILVLLGVVFVAGGLLLPANTHVERSVVIERAPAEVFATLDSFQKFNQWSPWFAADPQAEYRYEGPQSGVGARMSWSGNRAVGAGSQEIIESRTPERIVVALDFGGAPSKATYVLTPVGPGGTRVTWSFDSAHGFNPLARWFGLLFDKMIGGDYERGLVQLKSLMESSQAN